MRIAFDPFMHRQLGFEHLPSEPTEIGMDGIMTARGDRAAASGRALRAELQRHMRTAE